MNRQKTGKTSTACNVTMCLQCISIRQTKQHSHTNEHSRAVDFTFMAAPKPEVVPLWAALGLTNDHLLVQQFWLFIDELDQYHGWYYNFDLIWDPFGTKCIWTVSSKDQLLGGARRALVVRRSRQRTAHRSIIISHQIHIQSARITGIHNTLFTATAAVRSSRPSTIVTIYWIHLTIKEIHQIKLPVEAENYNHIIIADNITVIYTRPRVINTLILIISTSLY